MNRKLCMALLCLILSCTAVAQQGSIKPVIKEEGSSQYIIQDSVLIKTPDGAILSAVVVRKKEILTPQPAALLFFIYSNLERSLTDAKYAAAHGYVGIVADTRGKRLSPDPTLPYEHETTDVNAVSTGLSNSPGAMEKWVCMAAVIRALRNGRQLNTCIRH